MASKRSNPNYGIVSRGKPDKTSRACNPFNKVLKTSVNGNSQQKSKVFSEKSGPNNEENPLQGEKLLCPLHPKLDEVMHTIYQCSKFRKLSHAEKVKEAQKQNLCLACLKPHPTDNCDFKGNCFACNGKHVRAMHDPSSSEQEESE